MVAFLECVVGTLPTSRKMMHSTKALSDMKYLWSSLKVWFRFHFCWIGVQVLIDASFDFVFISAGCRFKTCSNVAIFWVQFGIILVPCWVHFGSTWGPF